MARRRRESPDVDLKQEVASLREQLAELTRTIAATPHSRRRDANAPQTPFAAWIDEMVTERFGTMTAFAKAAGISVSAFMRGVASGTFNVGNLLTIAKVTDTHPSTVLRLAGKGDVADRLEQLYGTGQETLTASQRDVLDVWGRLPNDLRKATLRALRLHPSVSSNGQDS